MLLKSATSCICLSEGQEIVYPGLAGQIAIGFYEHGWCADEVRQLFRLIDWMVQLPQALENDFHDEVARFEEERRMPYVTSVERVALRRGEEKGREEGLRDALATILETRFGAAGKKLLPKLKAIHDVERLRSLIGALTSAATLDEAKQLVRQDG